MYFVLRTSYQSVKPYIIKYAPQCPTPPIRMTKRGGDKVVGRVGMQLDAALIIARLILLHAQDQ